MHTETSMDQLEQEAHIKQMLADIDLKFEQIETLRKERKWPTAVTAAFIAAAVVLVSQIVPHFAEYFFPLPK